MTRNDKIRELLKTTFVHIRDAERVLSDSEQGYPIPHSVEDAVQKAIDTLERIIGMDPDMNDLENAILRANLRGTQKWVHAHLSGAPGAREQGVFRVDAEPGEDLDAYDLWICRWADATCSKLQPIRVLGDARAIYT
jgi:hypothetical protein